MSKLNPELSRRKALGALALLGATVFGLSGCGEKEKPEPLPPATTVDFDQIMEFPDRYLGQRITTIAYPSFVAVDESTKKCTITVGDKSKESHKDVTELHILLSLREDHQGGMIGVITHQSSCNQGLKLNHTIPEGRTAITGTVKRNAQGAAFIEIETDGLLALP